ncbi:inositol monophosphatase family protein [Microlunatus sp. Y2014]|uniref:inositol monophosphatase family protein n=1 Tax=Microlunatus sp. Y2014 TaxID=3418488 RepID=UPI003DA78A0A
MNDDDLALAFELAADAATISLSWSGGDVPTTIKEDGSPVSEGDLEVDRVLSDILAEERPDDGVLSEEYPERTGTSGRRWVIDPIDGTRQFISGKPGWGNHIALEVDGAVVLGIITRPEDDELFWAVRGEGAYRCGLDAPQDRSRPLRLSSTADLAAATVGGYQSTPDDHIDLLTGRTTWAGRRASPITDYLTGELDALVLSGGKVWDYAPLAILAREAGGDVRSRDGGRALDQEWILCSNGPLLQPLSQVMRIAG